MAMRTQFPRAARSLCALFLLFAPFTSSLRINADDTPANWIGTTGAYDDPANWDIGAVPLNDASATYGVVIPGGVTVDMDLDGSGEVTDFTLADDGVLTISPGSSYTVLDEAAIGGRIDVSGGQFIATNPLTVELPGNKSCFTASTGGTISVAAPAYSSTGIHNRTSYTSQRNANYFHVLFYSLGTDGGTTPSLLDLSSVQTLDAGFNDGDEDQNVQQIKAEAGGRIDLSGVQVVTAPYRNSYDRLDFLVESTGEIDLAGLQEIRSAGSGYTRFSYDTGTLNLPSLVSADRTTIEMGAGSTLSLASLETATNTSITLGVGSSMSAPALLSYNGGAITIPDQTTVAAGEITTLRNVALSISDGGSIAMPKLIDFSGSSVTLTPLRTFHTGGLTSCDNAKLHAADGAEWGVSTGEFAVVSYASTGTYSRTSYTSQRNANYFHLMLHAAGTDGGGTATLLDLSSLQSFNAGFNDGDDDQNVHEIKAEGGGRIDLSGVQTVTSPYRNSYDRVDFIVESGGEIDLTGLQEIQSAASGYTRFSYDTGPLNLPSLVAADRVTVEMGAASTLSLPSLETASNIGITFGAGSTMTAPQLASVSNLTLTLPTGMPVALPSLLTYSGGTLTVPDQATFTADEATGLTSVAISFSNGGSVVMPKLVAFDGSSVTLTPARTFHTGGLTSCDNARFYAEDGVQWGVSTGEFAVASYSSTGVYSRTSYTDQRNADYFHLMLHAVGTDGGGTPTLLDLSSLQSFNAGFNDGDNDQNVHQIKAEAGGRIDLSGVQTVTAPYRNSYDRIDFLVESGGQIDLTGLQEIQSAGSGYTRFAYDTGTLELPSLVLADRMTIEMGAASTLSLASLETASNSGITLGGGSTMTAPQLASASNLTLNLPTAMSLSLPSLLTYSGGTLTVPDQTTVTAGELTTLADVSVSFSDGGSVVMPKLVDFSGSSVTLTPLRTFDTGGLTSCDNARFHIKDGAQWGVGTGKFAAASYSTTGVYSRTSYASQRNADYFHLLLHSFGTDGDSTPSLLDLASLQSIDAGFNDGDEDQNVHQIQAEAGGRIDLSGVQLVTAPYRNSYDRIDFLVDGGGEIDLSGLQEIRSAGSGYTRFAYDGGSLLLPSLVTADRVIVELTGLGLQIDMPALEQATNMTCTAGAGATVSLTGLNHADGASVSLGSNSTLTIGGGAEVTNTSIELGEQSQFQVTGMWTFQGSSLTLTSPQVVDLGNLIDASRSTFQISESGTIDLSNLARFNADYQSYGASRTLLSADGPAAVIDLSGVVTFNGASWGNSGAWQYTVEATNGGIIDLSAVETVIGSPAGQGGGDDLLCFRAESDGEIRFSDRVRVDGRVRFELGSGGVLHVADLAALDHGEFYLNDLSTVLNVEENLFLGQSSRLIAAPLSRVNVGKSLVIASNVESDVDLDEAVVHLEGGGMRYLELAGEDLGLPSEEGPAGNFGIGQLIVGSPGEPTTVELLDMFDNGNRTSGAEAIYLYGLGSNLDGLVMHEGSSLVVDHLNAYAWIDGGWIHLNEWLQDGMAPSTKVFGKTAMSFDPKAQSITGLGNVPEPGVFALAFLALAGVGIKRHRNR